MTVLQAKLKAIDDLFGPHRKAEHKHGNNFSATYQVPGFQGLPLITVLTDQEEEEAGPQCPIESVSYTTYMVGDLRLHIRFPTHLLN